MQSELAAKAERIGFVLREFGAEMVQAMVILVVGLLLLQFFMRKIKVFIAKISDGDWQDENWVWIGVIFAVLGILVIAMVVSFPNTFYALFHQEYWALDKLLSKTMSN